MLTRILLIFGVLSTLISFNANADDDSITINYKNFYASFERGDLIKAETFLLNILEVKNSLSDDNLVSVYNNLGVVNIRLGRYNEALIYINLAEKSIINKQESSQELADIYINKARIYGIIKEFDKAIEYLNQALKLYSGSKKIDQNTYKKISTGYLNLGITYYEINDFKKALEYLFKSKEIRVKHSLSDKAFIFLNIAKVYVKTKDYKKAEENFLLSLASFDKEFGPNYYRTSSVLFDYGLFLRSIGRNQEAYNTHRKALEVCLKNYGDKHPYVALAYKHLGDHFYNQSNYKTALEFYQKSIVAVVKDFNDTSIFANPSLNAAIFNYRLLDNLKSKSQALLKMSLQLQNQPERLKIMESSYETINLALQLIERIRNEYSTYEGKLYLAENEKDTYLSAIQIAQELFNLSQNPDYIKRMYNISSLSKSRVLRDEVSENEILFSKNSPDSILLKRNELKTQISSYNKLIQDEYQKTVPDTVRIEMWKDQLFELNRSSELVYENIKSFSSQYTDLVYRTEPVLVNELQSKLNSDETIVEYFIPHNYIQGNRSLYIFTVSSTMVNFRYLTVDSLLEYNARIIRQSALESNLSKSSKSYKNYIGALSYMYNVLIKPIKNDLSGNRLVIIPDEEISFLPFDAFIKELPSSSNSSFDGFNYLIYDYSISYSYATSFIFTDKVHRTNTVVSFLPNYSFIDNSNGRNSNLMGAKSEVNSIREGFAGKDFADGLATEFNFKSEIANPAILHLAMHSNTDSINSRYSYLIFDSTNDSVNDGKLYNYEISMNRMESPLVVLSACNTGTGDLYHGEGVMSLARSFFLAGVSSVVNTLWDVNDESSSAIIIDFYRNLSTGMEKDEAMRLAKLNYIQNATPTYANPYYWAAYQVIGNKSPVKKTASFYFWIFGTALLISGVYLGYSIYIRKFAAANK